MKIELCLGSSCHVKGAQDILKLLKEAIKAHNLENKVTLAGTLCLGHCGEPGANLKIGEEIITGITKDNFDEFFKNKVIKPLATAE
jgi:NADH:ubiquinone oxidoreductase subunit E